MNAFSNHPSSSHRQKLFPSNLIGDFTFELERQTTRHKLFLQRNISRILQYHNKRLERDPISADSRSFLVPNPRTAENGTKDHIARSTVARTAVNGAAMMNGTTNTAPPVAPSLPTRAVAADTAAVVRHPRLKSRLGERSKRRSDRFKEVLDRVYEQVDAELILDLNNIRKKLNFKTNSIDDGERPAKRQKRDTVRCLCHLTIWDNRDGYAAIPLITKSSYCSVTGVDNGVHGHFVELELEKPFVIKAVEIRVPVTTKGISALEIIDKYFLEFKIIPCRVDSRWPPMPLLGQSDGDHFGHDVKKAGSEELQGAIVARYTHLPTAPDSEVPLSVFFLEEGKTFRTKYGLQVQSWWQKAGATPIGRQSESLDLESFLPAQTPPTNRVQASSRPPVAVPPRAIAKPLQQPQPEVCYSFAGRVNQDSEISQEFRNATLDGYRCPICSQIPRYEKLQHLQFHLSTAHVKYNFSIQNRRRNQLTEKLSRIHIKVEKIVRPAVKKEERTEQLAWVAPAPPFDLEKFVSGDHSWTNGAANAIVPKKTQISGYALAKDVPPFRIPRRRKLKAINLETRDDVPESVYTSISHRAVSPSEDARSETDDEIDNEWQISTHMQRLDLVATKQNWSLYKRELTKRWDRHRMEEQLEHTSYLSNSLIRFVRKQKEWLQNSKDDEILQCFFEFLASLKERRVIDDNVVADINELIFVDAPRQKSPAKAAREPCDGAQADKPHMSSANICPHCNVPILSPVAVATFCQDPSCATPLQRYHIGCVNEGHLAPVYATKFNDNEMNSLLVPILAEVTLRVSKSWWCPACGARQKEVLRKRDEEREERTRREREVIERAARKALGSIE